MIGRGVAIETRTTGPDAAAASPAKQTAMKTMRVISSFLQPIRSRTYVAKVRRTGLNIPYPDIRRLLRGINQSFLAFFYLLVELDLIGLKIRRFLFLVRFLWCWRNQRTDQRQIIFCLTPMRSLFQRFAIGVYSLWILFEISECIPLVEPRFR